MLSGRSTSQFFGVIRVGRQQSVRLQVGMIPRCEWRFRTSHEFPSPTRARVLIDDASATASGHGAPAATTKPDHHAPHHRALAPTPWSSR
jgi:hypothetical protein